MPRLAERLTPTAKTLTSYVATMLFDSIAVPRRLRRARELEVRIVPCVPLRAALEELARAIEGDAPKHDLEGLLLALVEATCAAAALPTARVLPGEALHVDTKAPLPAPAVTSIQDALDHEPLIINYPHPFESLDRVRALADQQRRGVLVGRNERLRKELKWVRPAISRAGRSSTRYAAAK